jgi:lipid II:glycine glycyltransferase (peptidoglycan interpeptide bridge formation enzyme)
LQTTAWGDLKAAFGWEVVRLAIQGRVDAGAQVLFRRLPLGFTLAYIPKGPVGGDVGRQFPRDERHSSEKIRPWEELWSEIDDLCRKRRSVFLKVEPDLLEGEGGVTDSPHGFRLSPHDIQPPRTMVVDLRGDEDQLLARMKQKTRYNIRLARKKGVLVSSSTNIELFYQLIRLTGKRDEFGVHSLDYYHRVFNLFYPRGKCELLLAEYEGQPLAAIMVFAHGERAWYFFGASSSEHRNLMPTYLLQWEAMRWARACGCVEYDLWGVPDADEEILEEQFTGRSDGLWGVYRFKRGFGGRLRRAPGPWDRVYRPFLYNLYRWWVQT